MNHELAFVHYLADNGKTRLALKALRRLPVTDTVRFLQGYYHYSLRQLDTAAACYLQVSPQAATYPQARFFGAYSLAHLRQYDTALRIVQGLDLLPDGSDSLLQQLQALELAGIYLLQRDTVRAKAQIGRFRYTYYGLADEQRRVAGAVDRIRTMPKRSPFAAGALSALLPGAGRWYAGRKKQAIGSFFQLAGLALLTWEAYHRHGPRSVPFYLFGTGFTVFYLSNIYGSAMAVKIKRHESNTILDNRILFDLHVPLRTVFR